MLLHPDDLPLWQLTHDTPPDGELSDGQQIEVGRDRARGDPHPGSRPRRGLLLRRGPGGRFTGDTLFNGGPGATGRSFSDKPLLVRSITDRLLSLPGQTIVKTGHGDDTTIADERPASWAPRSVTRPETSVRPTECHRHDSETGGGPS